MIDRMFSQEILNAHLRKRYCFNFFIYDCFPLCIQRLFKYCHIPLDCCLPTNYKPDPTKGTLLEEILNFNNKYSIRGITDEELYHFHKRYEKFKNRKNHNNIHKNFMIRIGSLFSPTKDDKMEEINQQIKEQVNQKIKEQVNQQISILHSSVSKSSKSQSKSPEKKLNDIPRPILSSVV